MSPLMGRPCSGEIHDGHSFMPCRYQGKYQERDKWWCGIHLPSKVALRVEKLRQRWQTRWDAKQRRWVRDGRIRDAERMLVDVVLDDQTGNLPGWLKLLADDIREARAE